MKRDRDESYNELSIVPPRGVKISAPKLSFSYPNLKIFPTLIRYTPSQVYLTAPKISYVAPKIHFSAAVIKYDPPKTFCSAPKIEYQPLSIECTPAVAKFAPPRDELEPEVVRKLNQRRVNKIES